MADRDVERRDAGAAAKHRADDLACVYERHPGAPALGRRAMLADEARLRDPDRRPVEQEPDVARDAEAPRVSDAMPVVQNEIRDRSQTLECGEHRGRLAERKQPGNIGKADWNPGDGVLCEFEPRQIEHRDRGPRRAPVALETDVHARDRAHLADPVLAHDAATQPLLERDRLPRGE